MAGLAPGLARLRAEGVSVATSQAAAAHMKSIVTIEIARPRRQVSMLFADPGNMTKWMHDLAAYEHVGGEPGAVGMRYRLVPKPKTRQRPFISTVTFMHLPERLALRLESKRVDVLVDVTFTALAKDRTRLV